MFTSVDVGAGEFESTAGEFESTAGEFESTAGEFESPPPLEEQAEMHRQPLATGTDDAKPFIGHGP